MPGIVLTFPISSGRIEAWRRFCQEIAGSRRLMYEVSRKNLGVTREQMALVEIASGSAAVTTLEANDVGLALNQILASVLPFDRWYREQLQALHGVNLAQYEAFSEQALVENQELVFEWSLPSSAAA